MRKIENGDFRLAFGILQVIIGKEPMKKEQPAKHVNYFRRLPAWLASWHKNSNRTLGTANN